MNGQLLVESKKGKGSTFKVIVPFHKIQLGKSSYDEQKNDYHSCFNGIKILVVDDTEINHEVLKGVFEDFEVNLFHAYNGSQCKEIAERELPDIILMDFHMPDIDGSEVTRNLKQSNLTKKYLLLVCPQMHLKAVKKRLIVVWKAILLNPLI